MIEKIIITYDKNRSAYLMIPYDDKNQPIKGEQGIVSFCYFNSDSKEDLWMNLETLKNRTTVKLDE